MRSEGVAMDARGTPYETLRLDQTAPGVCTLTLDRPDRLNAMTDTMFTELEHVSLALADDDEVRVVIVTGAGRGFCAGYDLADADRLADLGALAMLDQQERAARALLAFRTLRVPTIAAVNGAATGGGLALALAADIRIASAAALFSVAFVRVGLSAGDLGVSWLLTRLIGPAKAAEIAYTGRRVEADEAARIGLANSTVAPGELLPRCLELAQQILGNSPTGVQLSKRALQANMEVPSHAAAVELENRGQALLTRTADMPEALAAFREKRPPVFRGA